MHDIVDLADELKADTLRLHLGPTRWNSFTTKARLTWASVPWSKVQKPKIPGVRGIYAFTVQFTNPLLPKHGYVLYVGITGDKSSTSTLRTRFANYFTAREKEGRTRVGYMLNKWRNDLTFQFAEVPDQRFSLKKLEEQLCDSIVPHVVRNDLSAKLRQAKEAAGL